MRLNQIVAPQQQRDAKAEDELERDGAEGENEGVDQRSARGRIAPQSEIIVEADEMARSRADQVVVVERVEKALDHRPDRDRQHIDERRRRERDEEELALAGIGPAGLKGGVIIGRRRHHAKATLRVAPGVRCNSVAACLSGAFALASPRYR